MISLLFKSSLRLIAKYLTLSVVQIAGLAIGIAVFTITALFTAHESRFDRQHPDYQSIYRYVHRVQTDQELQSFAFTSATTGPALAERFSEVQSFTRVLKIDVSLKQKDGDTGFLEKNLYFADSNFLEMFRFPLRGNPSKDILKEPYTLLITPTAANKYFG